MCERWLAELGHFIICYVEHVMSVSIFKATQRAQNTSWSEQHFIYICVYWLSLSIDRAHWTGNTNINAYSTVGKQCTYHAGAWLALVTHSLEAWLATLLKAVAALEPDARPKCLQMKSPASISFPRSTFVFTPSPFSM